jgi:hypothetical protein
LGEKKKEATAAAWRQMTLMWKETQLPALDKLLSTGEAQPLPREDWPEWARSKSEYTGVWLYPVLDPLALSTGNLSTDNVHSFLDAERSANKGSPLRYYRYLYIKMIDGRVFQAGPFKDLEYERHRYERPSWLEAYRSTSTD